MNKTELPMHTPEFFGDAAQNGESFLYTTSYFLTFANMLELAPAPKEGDRPALKRILSADGANLILATFSKGQALNDHKAIFPITVQCLKGELAFGCAEDEVILQPGNIVHLPARIVHRVNCSNTAADGTSIMLLTMLSAK